MADVLHKGMSTGDQRRAPSPATHHAQASAAPHSRVVSLDPIGAGHAVNTAGKKRRGEAKARLTHPRIQGLPALVNGTKALPPTLSDLHAGLIDEPIDPRPRPDAATPPRRRG
jgi:hypothetical protein